MSIVIRITITTVAGVGAHRGGRRGGGRGGCCPPELYCLVAGSGECLLDLFKVKCVDQKTFKNKRNVFRKSLSKLSLSSSCDSWSKSEERHFTCKQFQSDMCSSCRCYASFWKHRIPKHWWKKMKYFHTRASRSHSFISISRPIRFCPAILTRIPFV